MKSFPTPVRPVSASQGFFFLHISVTEPRLLGYVKEIARKYGRIETYSRDSHQSFYLHYLSNYNGDELEKFFESITLADLPQPLSEVEKLVQDAPATEIDTYNKELVWRAKFISFFVINILFTAGLMWVLGNRDGFNINEVIGKAIAYNILAWFFALAFMFKAKDD